VEFEPTRTRQRPSGFKTASGMARSRVVTCVVGRLGEVRLKIIPRISRESVGSRMSRGSHCRCGFRHENAYGTRQRLLLQEPPSCAPQPVTGLFGAVDVAMFHEHGELACRERR